MDSVLYQTTMIKLKASDSAAVDTEIKFNYESVPDFHREKAHFQIVHAAVSRPSAVCAVYVNGRRSFGEGLVGLMCFRLPEKLQPQKDFGYVYRMEIHSRSKFLFVNFAYFCLLQKKQLCLFMIGVFAFRRVLIFKRIDGMLCRKRHEERLHSIQLCRW
jgi:hypothetical protein